MYFDTITATSILVTYEGLEV